MSLVGAIGVLLTALAYTGARDDVWWAEIPFWLGLAVLFIPITARLLSSHASRTERISLVVVLGLEFYLVAYLLSPFALTDYDAFLHLRTAQDIAGSQVLFQPNPLLPVSPYYPGLEIVTNAVSSVSGLSLFAAGVVVVGAGRVVLMLALYLLYERLSDSPRVAGIATLVYAANPHFLLFDANFAYESLALPLAMLALFSLACRTHENHTLLSGLRVVIWLGMGAVVVTHHLTSYALVAFLILWTIVFSLIRERASTEMSPGGPVLVGLGMIILWAMLVGNLVVSYLAPIFTGAGESLIQLVAGHTVGRQLFHDNTGAVAPLWERATTLASVGMIVLGLPFGLYQIVRYYRTHAVVMSLGIAALVYPASQILRLAPDGEEVAARAPEFAFVGLAFVLALSITQEGWLSDQSSWRRIAIVTGALAVVFIGQVIAGTGPARQLLPGPYLVEGDNRSIGPEGIDAALWAKVRLGPNHRVATDRDDEELMATYGNQWIVDTLSSGINVSPVFFSAHFGDSERAVLQGARIRYLVIDQRLSTGLPQFGYYFDSEEPGANQHKTPISAKALAKFDGVEDINRVFDSGDIVIYDVGAITHAP